MEPCNIEEEFVKVQGVETCVLKLGSLKVSQPESSPQILILIVPGNPGVPYFYEDFMCELYRHSDGKIPVWALGQAGHVRPPGQSLSVTDVETLYGLEAQVSHKLAFIREHVPSDVSLILIGHSIGCYMILNMLEDLDTKRVLRCFHLFPTIERMASSPNGQVMTPVLRYLRWIIVMAAFFLCLLPQTVRGMLMKFYFRHLDCYPDYMQKAILETVTPWTANFATYLAKLEMSKVNHRQDELLEKHLNKVSLYYGTIDGWAPVSYYEDFVARYPQSDTKLCDLSLNHAFVLHRSEGQAMAKILWAWAQSLKVTRTSSIW